jgi:hypothetical protein
LPYFLLPFFVRQSTGTGGGILGKLVDFGPAT